MPKKTGYIVKISYYKVFFNLLSKKYLIIFLLFFKFKDNNKYKKNKSL